MSEYLKSPYWEQESYKENPTLNNLWSDDRVGLQEKLLRSGGKLGEVFAPVSAMLAGYSPEAEAAIFPKGAQINSLQRSNLDRMYKGVLKDPIKGKYLANQYGRTDDPVWQHLVQNGSEQDKKEYLRRLYTTISPGAKTEALKGAEAEALIPLVKGDKAIRLNNPNLETLRNRTNYLADESTLADNYGPSREQWKADSRYRRTDAKYEAEKKMWEESSSDDILTTLRDRYRNVKTLDYQAPATPRSLNEAENFAKELGMDTKGMSIPDRFKQTFGKMKGHYGKETTPKVEVEGVGTLVDLKTPFALKHEGQWMRHSVGGYTGSNEYGLGGGMDAIKRGDVVITSLRDQKSGRPMLTFEADAKNGVVYQIKGLDNDTQFSPEQVKAIDKYLETTGYKIDAHPRYTWDDARQYLPEEIKTKYKDRIVASEEPKIKLSEDDFDDMPEDANDWIQPNQEELQANLGHDAIVAARHDRHIQRMGELERRAVEGGVDEIGEDDARRLLDHLGRNPGQATTDEMALKKEIEEHWVQRASQDFDFLNTFGAQSVLQYRRMVAEAGTDEAVLERARHLILSDFFNRNDLPF
jgi:hypothetical protein